MDQLKLSGPQLGIIKCINKMGDPGQLGTDELVRKIQISLFGPGSSMEQGKHYANWAWRPITSDKKSGGSLISVSSEEREKFEGPPQSNLFDEGECSFVPILSREKLPSSFRLECF